MKEKELIPKSIIHLLIQYGAPIVKGTRWDDDEYECINYYGSCLNIDGKLALEALESIEKYGIDYDGCDNYTDDSGSGFNGTDADNLSINFMRGDIATKDGKVYRFAAIASDVKDIFKFVCWLADNPPTLETAIAGLKRTIKEGGDYFKYQDFKIK